MKKKKEQLEDVLKILSPALDKLVDIPSRSHGMGQSIIRLQEARMWLMVTIDSIEKDGDVEGGEMSKKLIKPCPFCGSERVGYYCAQGGYHYWCYDCQAESGAGCSEVEARKMWNKREKEQEK